MLDFFFLHFDVLGLTLRDFSPDALPGGPSCGRRAGLLRVGPAARRWDYGGRGPLLEGHRLGPPRAIAWLVYRLSVWAVDSFVG